MSAKPFSKPDEELDALVGEFLGGRISEDREARLLELIASSEDARVAWKAAVVGQAELGLLCNPPRAFTADELARIPQSSEHPPTERVDCASPPNAPKNAAQSAWRARLSILVFATAAMLLGVIVSRPWVSRPWSEQLGGQVAAVIVTGESEPEPQWVGEITASVGSDLERFEGPTALLSIGQVLEFSQGLVELRINDGVTLVARGPARLRIDAADQVWLGFGQVTATVDKGFEGFKVTTEDAVVTDLGTSFSVNADRGEASLVTVHTGEVDVHNRVEGSPASRVVEGQAVRVVRDDASPSAPTALTRTRPLLSLSSPHTRLECDKDTYIVGGEHFSTNRGEWGQIWVKRDLSMPEFNRIGWIGFNLSEVDTDRLIGARLELIVEPNDWAEQREPTNQRSSCDWQFQVHGFWDEGKPQWDQTELTWHNAPGLEEMVFIGGSLGPASPLLLGDFVVHGRGEAGDKVVIESQELINFLRADRDGRATLIISRKSGYRWRDGSEDRVVHSFASLENKNYSPPTLELWFDDGSTEAP